MKRMTKVLLALALTVVPTGVLYAELEDYTPSPTPSCGIHPTLGPPWIRCDMNEASGCTTNDWSMDVNLQNTVQPPPAFAGCQLTIEGGNVGFWYMGLAGLNGSQSRHVGCDKQKLYHYKMNQGNPTRHLRCRSLASGTPVPTGFTVRFGTVQPFCITPDP